MFNKKEVIEILKNEIKANENYSAAAIQKANEGKIGAAKNLLEIANTAYKCANQRLSQLKEISKGKLTNEELDLVYQTETLYYNVRRAYKTIKNNQN